MVCLRWLACAVVVAGCNATTVVAPPSATDNLEPPPFEPHAQRLTQTEDTTITTGLSVACADATGTTENSWYRVFALRDYGIRTAFTVNRVNFGVQNAVGKQRVKVSIGTFAGEPGVEQLDTTKIDVLAMTTIPIVPTDTGEMAQANFPAVEIPYGENLVVEVRTEGHDVKNGTYFYLGATEGRETVPGYLRAPACSGPDPLMTSALGYVKSHLIISVSGTD
jgi:hypothetical protein